MNNDKTACMMIQPLLEEYALDALEPAEMREVAQHLATCIDCVKQVADYEELLGMLPPLWAEVSGIEPDQSLKDQIISRLPSDSDGVAKPQRWLRRWGAWVPLSHAQSWRLAFLVTLALLVGVLVWGFQTNRELAEERFLRQELLKQMGTQEDILGIIDSSQTNVQVLQSLESSPTSPWGKFYYRPDRKDVVIAGWDMPPLLPGHTYYAWLRNGEEIIFAGPVDVNEHGFGLVYFEGEIVPEEYEGAGFAMQPIGETALNRQVVIVWQAE